MKFNIGPVESAVYKEREKHPLVIPQVDPDAFDEPQLDKLLKDIKELGINVISVGGSVFYPDKFQKAIDLAAKKYDFTTLVYPAYSSMGLRGVSNKTAMYWIRILNAANEFYRDDFANFNAIHLKGSQFEPIPTAYIFDDRGTVGSGEWMARAFPVPRHKPSLSLLLALGAQYSGTRFLILGGGSGAQLPPPEEHVKLIKDKTNLFLLPTSGIRSVDHAKKMFESGADGIHISKLLESKEGFTEFTNIVKYVEKDFG
jgi:geranylgeranylglyceryl phosphate synthase family protein